MPDPPRIGYVGVDRARGGLGKGGAMAAVPKRVSTRIASGVRKYQKVLQAAKDRDVNESDTVVIITDFLSEVCGYDKYSEITTEFSIRGTYCDLAVKVDGKVEFLIEAKAIGSTLRSRHLRQAIGYASQNGVEWVVLTNGVLWNVYRLRFEKPISHDLVFSLDLLSASPRGKEVVEQLFTLSREGLGKSAIEALQEKREALNPFLIGAVLQSDPAIGVLRRELRRISPGAKIDAEELLEVLREEVLKREVVEGEEARSAGGKVKRAAGRTLRRRSKVTKKDAKTLASTPRAEEPLPPPSMAP